MTQNPIASTGPVVTLFESYGCGAEEVGRRVAAELGVEFLSQVYSSDQLEAADRGQAEEADGPFLRLFKRFGQDTVDHLDNILIPSDQSDENQLILDNNRTILAATARGGVVLGRNATVVLADDPRAVHVKLDGPAEVRVARAAAAAGIDLARASRRQLHEDDVRAAMSQRLYHWDPRLNDRYDLVVNTGRLDTDTVVALIVAAVRRKAQQA